MVNSTIKQGKKFDLAKGPSIFFGKVPRFRKIVNTGFIASMKSMISQFVSIGFKIYYC